MEWESLDIGADAARRRWEEAGRPIVPSLVVDGTIQPVLHVSQLAGALGLPVVASLPSSVLAADTVALLEEWSSAIGSIELDALLAPTPSRGRSLRNLTVNVFHPFELLPDAWLSGRFAWDPDGDGEREEELPTAAAVRTYASGVLAGWSAFVQSTVHALDEHDPHVLTLRGEAPYSVVLDSQRWHAAYHLRQLENVLGGSYAPQLTALALPADVF